MFYKVSIGKKSHQVMKDETQPLNTEKEYAINKKISSCVMNTSNLHAIVMKGKILISLISLPYNS